MSKQRFVRIFVVANPVGTTTPNNVGVTARIEEYQADCDLRYVLTSPTIVVGPETLPTDLASQLKLLQEIKFAEGVTQIEQNKNEGVKFVLNQQLQTTNSINGGLPETNKLIQGIEIHALLIETTTESINLLVSVRYIPCQKENSVTSDWTSSYKKFFHIPICASYEKEAEATHREINYTAPLRLVPGVELLVAEVQI
jgi:hypothetical protein